MNSEDSRNLILAIVLSLAVLIGWNYFYGAPQLQKDRQAQTQANAPAGAGQSGSSAALPQGAAPAVAHDQDRGPTRSPPASASRSTPAALAARST